MVLDLEVVSTIKIETYRDPDEDGDTICCKIIKTNIQREQRVDAKIQK